MSEASRQFDLTLPEIEVWIDEGKRAVDNALRPKPEDAREQQEQTLAGAGWSQSCRASPHRHSRGSIDRLCGPPYTLSASAYDT